jgi:hypothetical protein
MPTIQQFNYTRLLSFTAYKCTSLLFFSNSELHRGRSNDPVKDAALGWTSYVDETTVNLAHPAAVFLSAFASDIKELPPWR